MADAAQQKLACMMCPYHQNIYNNNNNDNNANMHEEKLIKFKINWKILT